MRQLLYKGMASLMLALSALSFGTAPLVSAATTTCPTDSSASSSKDQVLDGVGQTTNDCSGAGENTLVQVIVNTLSIVVGVVSVIMIILAGMRYVTSGGDSAKVGAAKTALISAVIGLAILALTRFLAVYVFNTGAGL